MDSASNAHLVEMTRIVTIETLYMDSSFEWVKLFGDEIANVDPSQN